MSVLSNIVLSGATLALGFAAGGTALTIAAPPPAEFSAPERMAAGVSDGQGAKTDAATPALARSWPAVFGTEVIPEPEPVPQPEPVAAPLPDPEPDLPPEPEIRYDYILTGIVADDRDGWALISLGGMPQIVEAGDVLEGGEIVNRIDARGVWITWREIPQLIPVNRADTSTMMRDLSAEAPPAPPSDGGEVDVVLERLDRHGLEETFESAGRLVMTEMADGMPGLDVVWIRQGELYDRIGLRTGDKILRVNGSMVETRDLLAHLPDAITNGGTMALEILRDGTRQIIKVNLGQG